MQGRNQGESKGSADPPEMSGGARFGDGARFGGGARFDIDHTFLWGPPAPKLLHTGLLRQYTLLRTFLVSILFGRVLLDSFNRGPLR